MSQKILFAQPSVELYGADRMGLTTAALLQKSGFEVSFCVPEDGPLVALANEYGVTVEMCAIPVLRKELLTPLGLARLSFEAARGFWQAIRILRKLHADLVYVNTITQPLWILAAFFCRKPVVVHVREAEDAIRPTLQFALLAPLILAKRIIVNSDSTGQWVRCVLGSRADKKLKRVYNGRRWRTASPAITRWSPGFPLQIALVGRISPRKGQDLAISALATTVRGGLDSHLHIIGAHFRGYEWYLDELRSSIKRYELEDKVTFHGFLSDISEVLRFCHVGIVPSRSEPFGTVALELSASGLALIVADVQGLCEIVNSPGVGVTVPADDSHAIASAIFGVVKDPAASADTVTRMQLRANEIFGIDRYESEIIELCAEVSAPKKKGT